MTEVSELFLPPGRDPRKSQVQNGRPPRPRPFLTTAKLVSLVLIVAVATVSAYLSSNSQRKEYGAEVTMRIDTGGRDTDSILPVMATQKVILRSETVLRPAATELGVSIKRLEESVRVGTLGDSEVLRLVAVDHDPERARRMAQVVADTYISAVSGRPPDEGDPTVAFLKAESEQLAASLARVRARLSELEAARRATGSSPTAEERQLEVESTVLLRRLGLVEDRLTTIEVDRPSVDVRPLSAARVLEDPVSPKPLRAALGGFVVGVLLAAATLAVVTLRR